MTSIAARQTEISRLDRSTERIYFAARRAACRAAPCRAQMNRLIEKIRSEKFQCRRLSSPPAAVPRAAERTLLRGENCIGFGQFDQEFFSDYADLTVS